VRGMAAAAARVEPRRALLYAATATLRPGSAGSEAPRRPAPSCPPGAEEAPRAPPSPPPKPGAAVAAAPSGSKAGALRDEDRGPPAWFTALVGGGLYIIVRLNIEAAAGEVSSLAASRPCRRPPLRDGPSPSLLERAVLRVRDLFLCMTQNREWVSCLGLPCWRQS